MDVCWQTTISIWMQLNLSPKPLVQKPQMLQVFALVNYAQLSINSAFNRNSIMPFARREAPRKWHYRTDLSLVTAGLDAHVKPIAWGKSRIANRLNCVIGRLQRKLKPM